jgi:glucuronoarabinoxylan endo-1,4-beta-xylanase
MDAFIASSSCILLSVMQPEDHTRDRLSMLRELKRRMNTKSCFTYAIALCAGLAACSSKSHDVTLDWSDVRQSIDGFGASSAFFGQNLTDDQADQLFDPKKGIGVSLLRTMIGLPADTQSDGSEPASGAAPMPTAPEITTAQQAMVRGCQVWAAAWTPPPIWKTTNSKNGSGTDSAGNAFATNKLDPAHYQDFAAYLGQYVDLLAAADPPVPVMGVSPVNEPDYTATWDNAQWTGAELTTFISQYMGPTFAQQYPNVKVIAPETANIKNGDKFITPILADPGAASAVSVVAVHDYGPNIGNYKKPQQAGKSFWETEWSQENTKGDTPDPTMASALVMAQRMHGDLVTSEVTAWSWWAIYITEDGLNDNTRLNPAFIQPDATMGAPYMFKRGYAFGNWSKFVRPGFQRLAASDNPNALVYTEAYRDATHLAIIAINGNNAPVKQKFAIKGNTIDTLTPWVTSPDDNLAAKDPVGLTDGDFTYELPAQSVVTFINWDANTETPGLTTIPGTDGGTDVPKIATCQLDCTAAVVPDNVASGGVTDFSDWNISTGKWGSTHGLYGAIYGYAGSQSTMSAGVDTANKDLHGTGMVAMGDYGGIGLSYCACSTVASFTQVQFTVSGSWPGCDLQMQIKTFDETPTSQNPPGGCTATSCYNYPVVLQVASPSPTPTTVTVPLSSFSNWSPTLAAEVVGVQWQWTYTPPDASADAASDEAMDAGAGCPIDATVTNIKFLP